MDSMEPSERNGTPHGRQNAAEVARQLVSIDVLRVRLSRYPQAAAAVGLDTG